MGYVAPMKTILRDGLVVTAAGLAVRPPENIEDLAKPVVTRPGSPGSRPEARRRIHAPPGDVAAKGLDSGPKQMQEAEAAPA